MKLSLDCSVHNEPEVCITEEYVQLRGNQKKISLICDMQSDFAKKHEVVKQAPSQPQSRPTDFYGMGKVWVRVTETASYHSQQMLLRWCFCLIHL